MAEKRTMAELGRMSPDSFRQSPKMPVVIVLENIRSALNVGSIFRSADAFRAGRIVCTGYTAVPPHREVLKTALGATETMQWAQSPSALQVVRDLVRAGVTCLAVEQVRGSIPLHRFEPDFSRPLALVFGNEVSGVSQEVVEACQGALEIVQQGTKHSLNVAVAAGIVLHHLASRGGGGHAPDCPEIPDLW